MRRGIVLILILTLMLSLTACGADDKETTNENIDKGTPSYIDQLPDNGCC